MEAAFRTRMDSPAENGTPPYDPANFMQTTAKAAEVIIAMMAEGYPRSTILEISHVITNAALDASYANRQPQQINPQRLAS